VIAAQPRARRLVEIVRFNAQDARQFSHSLVRDAIASVFIAADLPRRCDPWGSPSERKKGRRYFSVSALDQWALSRCLSGSGTVRNPRTSTSLPAMSQIGEVLCSFSGSSPEPMCGVLISVESDRRRSTHRRKDKMSFHQVPLIEDRDSQQCET